jgi:regulator of RNase E activity RraA
VNRPVAIGGALVMPGDIVVADGDGVIVVPRDRARSVAAFAREVMEKTRPAGVTLPRLRLPPDASVKK